MARYLITFFFLLLASIVEPKLPEIAPRDVKNKVEEILRAHASYKKLTPQLIQRTLENYIEELDPTKTYFLESELTAWLSPSEDLLQNTLRDFNQSDFTIFETIHKAMIASIERRQAFEQELSSASLPTDVKSDEFKDLSWAKSPEELLDRLLRIKALQIATCDRLEPENRDLLMARIDKRRTLREAEIIGETPADRSKLMLVNLLKAITTSLDSHTNYFTPMEANQFIIQIQRRLFGIGAQLRDNLDGLSIVRILENSPASQNNKLKINDRIVAVNHESIVGMDISDSVELIRGETGTTVILTVLRESGEGEGRKVEKFDVELVRNEIVLEETRLESSYEAYGDGVIVYLRLFSFYQDSPNPSSGSSSAKDIRKALEQIKAEHKIHGVILDLRSNSGGYLDQAVEVSRLFMNKGIVVSLKNNEKLEHKRGSEGTPAWGGPLLILVNRASASAAEIVAQSLQDYGRALVVGDDRTFGKGTFQTSTLNPANNAKINPQGEYKVTRDRYYTVSGKSPQLTGVISDIVVPGILSELDIGEKFSKFPLENDEISPHFDDDFSELPPFHRLQMKTLYKDSLQKQVFAYAPYLQKLIDNSKQRIEKNKNYQNFLQELAKKNYDAESIELFDQGDLQRVETFNVMKDLIFLMQTKPPACNKTP